jgi:uncharacterized protein YutD
VVHKLNNSGYQQIKLSHFFPDLINTIALPTKAETTKDYVGETATASGWGKTEYGEFHLIFYF